MTADTIYFDFMRCEDKSADLYLDLSAHFCDEAELSWFWVEMAMGKKQQAGLLHYCLEKGLFAQDLPSPFAIRTLEEYLEELSARASDPALALDGAFDIAIQVETSEIQSIRDRLTMPIQGPEHILQKKVNVSRANSFGKLKNAAERFAVSPALRMRIGHLTP